MTTNKAVYSTYLQNFGLLASVILKLWEFKGLYQCDTFKKSIFFWPFLTVYTFKNILWKKETPVNIILSCKNR